MVCNVAFLLRLGGAVALVALIAFAATVVGCDGKSPEPGQKDKPAKTEKKKRVSPGKPKATVVKKEAKSKKKLTKAERKAQREKLRVERALRQAELLNKVDESLPPQERRIMKRINEALAGESLAGVASAAKEAKKSAIPAVRARAVEALGWFGKNAIADLTGYLSDSDEEVASDAQMAWEQALSEIEDDGVKLQYIETAMTTMDNGEMLDAISMNLNQVSDEGAAVETIVRIVDSGSPVGAEKAKEAYSFITGEEWTNKTDAMNWANENRSESGDAPEDAPEEAEAEK